jgi:hypothetical protein
MHIYSSLCDDFGIFCSLATELPFPTNRETVLSFFEALQKEFPQLRHFYAREADEFALEQDKTEDTYASVTLELRRLSCGQHNPGSFSDVDTLVERVLELAPYYLNLSPLDLTAVDVLFGFDLVYNGNHDAVVLEALGAAPWMEGLLHIPEAKVLNYQPALTLGLDETYRLQCRLQIETRTTTYQVRTGEFHDEPISVYFSIRQYRHGEPIKNLPETYRRLREEGQELVEQYIIPQVVRPLAQAIGAK